MNNEENINNINNNESRLRNAPRGSFSKNPNREEDDYSVNNNNFIQKKSLICSGEEFYDMDEYSNDEENNFKNQIQIKTKKKF